jgi:PAS domain S-box-containing protein
MKVISVERLTLIGLSIMVLALLMVGSIALNIAMPFNAAKSVDHSHRVMASLNDLQRRFVLAENHQLHYFLTQDKAALAARDQVLQEIEGDFRQLEQLTKDNELQQSHLAQLHAKLTQAIATMRNHQNRFAARDLPTQNATNLMDQAQSSALADMFSTTNKEEKDRLEQRQQKAALRIQIVLASVTFLLLLLLLWAWRQRRAGLQRMEDEKKTLEVREVLLKMGALQNAIFNSANFSIIATDAQGVIQLFNVGAEHMLGYAAADVVNKIAPNDISDAQEVITRAAALSLEFNTSITVGFDALVFKASRGIEDIYELTYICKDGSRLPAIVSVSPLRDAQEKIIGYLLIGTDNTVRKQAEAEQALLDQRLRDQQFYTRSLIESNIDALMTTDPRGIISDVNQQMEALTGSTRDELIGAPFKNYFTDADRAEAAILSVLSEGKVTDYELTVQARDGKQTVVSYNAVTFHDRERKLQGVFAAARDVTERKQIESALQKNNIELESAKAAAEKANRAKSDFLSSMSHELRTPLNAVLGFAQLMVSDNPPPSPQQKFSLDQILQGGWYLLRLINEILDLAMIESGKVSMSHEAVFLEDVLKDCHAMILPQAQQRGVQMHFPEFIQPLYIHGDRTRLKQVMINLLSNAIKYNRVNGAVDVDYILVGEDRLRIRVQDGGIGLHPDQLAQLFQPFNRLGQALGNEEGTGIGLVVTKQLVELMSGTIGVESQVGIGSIFWIELAMSKAPELMIDNKPSAPVIDLDAEPAADANAVSPIAREQLKLPLRTLLYVEDNPANLALVEQLISRRTDLKLLTAIDAHSGITSARLNQPDVILMDINLPGLSGFGALRILLDDDSTKHIPVVALSANAMPRDIEKGMQAGFFRYLTKPIQVAEFMATLDLALIHAKLNAKSDETK